MSAEELLQQKTWAELTTADKEILGELAASEEEFVLLKNMLSVATGENTAIPPVSPQVLENLQQALATPVKRMIPYKTWMAVAASVLLGIAVWQFWPKANDSNQPAADAPVAIQQPATTEPVTVKDSLFSNPTTVPQADKNIARQPNIIEPKKIANPQIPLMPDNTPATNRDIALTTVIRDHAELLDYVTEVYD